MGGSDTITLQFLICKRQTSRKRGTQSHRSTGQKAPGRQDCQIMPFLVDSLIDEKLLERAGWILMLRLRAFFGTRPI